MNGRRPVSAQLPPCRSAARDEAGVVLLSRCRNLFRSSAGAAAIRRPVLSGVPGTVRDGKASIRSRGASRCPNGPSREA